MKATKGILESSIKNKQQSPPILSSSNEDIEEFLKAMKKVGIAECAKAIKSAYGDEDIAKAFSKFYDAEIFAKMMANTPSPTPEGGEAGRCVLGLGPIIKKICEGLTNLVKNMLWWVPSDLTSAILTQLSSDCMQKVLKPNNLILSITLRACLVAVLMPMTVFGCWSAFFSFQGHDAVDNMDFVASAYDLFFACFYIGDFRFPTSLITFSFAALQDLPSALSSFASSALADALPGDLVKASVALTALATLIAIIRPLVSFLASLLAAFQFVADNKKIGDMAGEEAAGEVCVELDDLSPPATL